MPRRNKSQQVFTPSEIPPALQLTENFPVGAYVFYRDPQDNGPRFSFFSNRLLEMLDITREELDADPMAATGICIRKISGRSLQRQRRRSADRRRKRRRPHFISRRTSRSAPMCC